jgi:hypothetical protein
VCLFFTFDLLLIVFFSEMLDRMIIGLASSSNPYNLLDMSVFILTIFGIIPLSLLSIWLINPLAVKKLLSTFGLSEKSLDKKKIEDKNRDTKN